MPPVKTTGLVAKSCASVLVGGLIAMPSPSGTVAAPEYSTSEAGNPFVDGWYAGPDTARYDGRYWVFPTTSKSYAEQTYLDAFSSTDLVHWTKHSEVLKTADVPRDMTNLVTFPDGSTYKEITPADYVEGPQMFKRGGKYYLMWSEGGWTGPDYSVSYAISDSPTGPFEKIDRLLAQDPPVAKGSGHNSVINVPGTDIWYIVHHHHHRRPLSETDGNHRQPAYDRMYLNPDGTIRRIQMGVKDNFADGNALGGRTYGGSWSADGGRYRAGHSLGGKALLDTDFADFTYDADVRLGSGGGDAGLNFRVNRPSVGVDGYTGYYAGIRRDGRVVLGRAADSWTPLATAPTSLDPGSTHRMRVTAVGSSIKVYVDDMTTPRISVTDGTYRSGANGVRVFDTDASFDNVAVGPVR
ncbi:family 43 glycosylhydrolase [Streptomyces sp. NPDC056296]|uniref:family 43 glycosylhydrolase n=1 Tax=Streptomyces sp. NPDC056296 TaxID=3345775 RepID=UPI0035E28045